MAATKKTATKMTKDQMEARMAEMMAMMAEMSKALEATNARALAAEAKNAELADELMKTPAQRRAEAKAKVEAEVQREAFIQRAVDKALADLHGAVAHRFYSERKGNGAQRLGELDYECEEAAWVYEKVLMESANPDREEARKAVAFMLPSIEGGDKKPKAGKGAKRAGVTKGHPLDLTIQTNNLNGAAEAVGLKSIPYGGSSAFKNWRKIRTADDKAVVAVKVTADAYVFESSLKKMPNAETYGSTKVTKDGRLYVTVTIDSLADAFKDLTTK